MFENALKKSIEVGGRTLTLETGKMARQASGAVLLLTVIPRFWPPLPALWNRGKGLISSL